MKPVRIAVQVHPQHADYAAVRRTVVGAESLGVDIAYNWDHFYPLYGEPDGRHFECWTMLAAWAEQTERIEIGPLVTCNSYRNPHLLADMARTIDHISNGRLIFGIGSGWFRRDYDEYGYEFGTAATRLRALESSLPVIEARWNKLNPRPTRKIPILIGGTGERITLRLVAEHGDAWHAMFPDHPDELVPKVEALGRWCTAVGRDPSEIEWSVGLEPDELSKVLVRHADTYLAMGFRQFTVGLNGPDYELGPVRDWLAWRDEKNRTQLSAA